VISWFQAFAFKFNLYRYTKSDSCAKKSAVAMDSSHGGGGRKGEGAAGVSAPGVILAHKRVRRGKRETAVVVVAEEEEEGEATTTTTTTTAGAYHLTCSQPCVFPRLISAVLKPLNYR
jgi:hypothetical protein